MTEEEVPGQAPEQEAGAEPQGPEWVDVSSSAVSSIGFNEEDGTITVIWNNGAESSFDGDRQTFESLTGAGSVGKAVNAMMGRGG